MAVHARKYFHHDTTKKVLQVRSAPLNLSTGDSYLPTVTMPKRSLQSYR